VDKILSQYPNRKVILSSNDTLTLVNLIVLLGVKPKADGYIDSNSAPRDIELATVTDHSHHLP
jgi:hypothetical protein